MNDIIDLEDIKHKCRVCLTPSNQMIALTCKLEEENDESPQICSALENIFSTKVEFDSNYPEGVCLACYRKIKISYGLKTTFKKSQYILEKYVSVLNVHNEDDCNNPDDFQNPHDSFDEDEKNVIVKDDSCDDHDKNVSNEPDIFIKLETEEENFIIKEESDEEELTDFVILEVTDDDAVEPFHIEEQDGIKEENEKDMEDDTVDSNISAEFIDPNKYTIENIIPQPKVACMCPFCNKFFSTKKALDRHTKSCQRHKLVQCEFCDQQFSFMKKHHHMKMKHPDYTRAVVKCQICDKVFENFKARTYHIKTKHGLKKFVCKICGKAFHFKNGLATHMDTHSKDQFKEICPECGKGFHYRGGLFYHMKMHKNERNYLCTYCSARFLNISGLKKHIRIHTGEKPCQCEFCGKSFRSNSILQKHEKIHTGHRPHSCTYCGKGFISKYNLKVHMAGHSGNYRCVFCEKSYLNQEVLKLHFKFKHNMTEDDVRQYDGDSSAE